MRKTVLACLLVGGVLALGRAGPGEAYGQPGKGKPGDPKGGPGAAGKDLRHAYDALAEVSQLQAAGKDRLPRELGPLVDEAKGFYRAAVPAFGEGDRPRAAEM